MTKVSSSMVWERCEEELRKESISRYCEEYAETKLWIGVILSGGKEKDYEYLNGDEFLYHCELAALDSDSVRRVIDRAIYYIDNQIPLVDKEEVQEDEDDDFNY